MTRTGKLSDWRVGMVILFCAPIVMQIGTIPLHSQAARKAAKPAAQISPAAQQLLDRTVQALGGESFLKSKTLSTQGRAFSIADGVTAGFVTYKSLVEYPDKRRLAYGFGRNKSVILINNGSQGWELDQYGVIEQSEKRLHAWIVANRYSLENVLRSVAHEPGVLILPGGQDFVDNLAASILDIMDSRQVDVKLYINPQTYLPIQISYRVRDPEVSDWDDYKDMYSDYHNIDGIKTPMHLVRYVNGERTAETFRTSAKYNVSYPPGFFEPER